MILKNRIENNGSIQNIDEIPENIKNTFKTEEPVTKS